MLFLTDRNVLADQAYRSFNGFAEDARLRIRPGSVSKDGKVPTNGSIFFTIFQTFMAGDEPYFGQYPKDFFDLIIIDECHRGGANDESTWRGIMEYFDSAVQLGLTATPRVAMNVNTYQYFSYHAYEYSLRQGIDDGFLTPFRHFNMKSTIDEYHYTPDDVVLAGEVDPAKTYTEQNFYHGDIKIAERDRGRVRQFMDKMDRYYCHIKELYQSLNIIEQLIDNIPEGDFYVKQKPIIKVPEGQWYFSVEGASGEFGVYLHSKGDKSPYRMKMRPMGLTLTGALDPMLRGQKIADLITTGAAIDFVIPDIDR